MIRVRFNGKSRTNFEFFASKIYPVTLANNKSTLEVCVDGKILLSIDFFIKDGQLCSNLPDDDSLMKIIRAETWSQE